MRKSSVLLLTLFVILNGCIVRYHGFPDTASESPTKDHTVSALPAHPGFERCDVQPSPFGEGWRLLEHFVVGLNLFNPIYWFAYPGTIELPQAVSNRWQRVEIPVQGGHVLFVSRPNRAEVSPQDGLTCVAQITTAQRLTFMEGVNGLLSGITFTVIPLYTPDAIIYSVKFSVSKGERLSQEYQYHFSKGGLAGLLVLPFAWVNFFTSSEHDALQAISQRFLFDLQRDHLKLRAASAGGLPEPE